MRRLRQKLGLSEKGTISALGAALLCQAGSLPPADIRCLHIGGGIPTPSGVPALPENFVVLLP